MSIKINGSAVSPSFENLQATDFSKVTAQPEFVLEGKNFYDETGQLREGTLPAKNLNPSADVILQVKTATENGELAPDAGFDGFSKVLVNVQPKLQEKTATENGELAPDAGFDGFSKVLVNVPSAGDAETEELLAALYDKTVTTDQCDKLAADYQKYLEYNFYQCAQIESVELKSTTDEKVSSYAFYRCTGIKTLTSADDCNITTLDVMCFGSCTSMERAELPSTLTKLNGNNFNACYALKRVVFKKAPIYMPSDNFAGCKALEILDFSALTNDTLPALSTTTHMSSTTWKALVPVRLIRTMKTAPNWCDYKDRIICKQGAGGRVEAYFGLDLDTHMTLYVNGEAYDHCDNLESSDIEGVGCIGIKYDEGCSGGVLRLVCDDPEVDSITIDNEQDVLLPDTGYGWSLELVSNASEGVVIVADCEIMSASETEISLYFPFAELPDVYGVSASVKMNLDGYEGNTYSVTVDRVEADGSGGGTVYLDATAGDAQQLYTDYNDYGTVTLTITFEELVWWYDGADIWIQIPKSKIGEGDYADWYEGRHEECGTTFYYYGDTEANCPSCGAPFVSNADTGDNVTWL